MPPQVIIDNQIRVSLIIGDDFIIEIRIKSTYIQPKHGLRTDKELPDVIHIRIVGGLRLQLLRKDHVPCASQRRMVFRKHIRYAVAVPQAKPENTLLIPCIPFVVEPWTQDTAV